jgi:hypothetical protein
MSEAQAPIQVRTIRVEATRSGDDEILIAASLVDERPRGGPRWFGADPPSVIHDMRLAVRVRRRDLVITGVEGDMPTHPYRICPEALPALSRLVDVSVAHGFTRAVNERLGRQNGCAHFTALVHAMAPVVKQAAGALEQSEDDLAGQTANPWFVNTCQAWRENGPLHRLISAGDEAGLRGMSAYPPPPAR